MRHLLLTHNAPASSPVPLRHCAGCRQIGASHRRHRPSPKPRGFTLVELMVSIAVLGVIVSLAVPSFAELIAANRLTTQADSLKVALSLAHAEAMRRAQPVTLLSNDASTYSKGWSVFPDADANGSAANPPNATDGLPVQVAAAFKGTATTTRVTRSAVPAPFTYTTATDADRMRVIFTSRGAMASGEAAFFKVCDPAKPGVKGRIVQVNVVGRTSLDTASASCP